jgi:hypothetical protein
MPVPSTIPPKTHQTLPSAIVALLLLIPIMLNAVTLLPELTSRIPAENDGAMHFLYVQRASDALANGSNPFDFWVPELGYGFPQFHYYQHLPYLVIVALHRILLKQVDLLTFFNLVRYALLVCFPLTVFWSLRMMEFSPPGAALAGAFAALMTGPLASLGFEYESYLWSGYGMYTQLWAMHLIVIWLGCIQRLLRTGGGYFGAVAASATLVVSHPFYAYMAGATGLAVMAGNILMKPPASLRYLIRLSIVAALAMIVTAYFWLPFFQLRSYFNIAHAGLYNAPLSRMTLRPQHIPRIAHLGRSPHTFWAARVAWHFFGSWQTVPLVILIGIGIATPFLMRTTRAVVAVSIFLLWLLLFMSPWLMPFLATWLPARAALDFRRFVGGVDLAAILLVGAAGEWLWMQFERAATPWPAILAGLTFVILLAPMLHRRWQRNATNAAAIEAIGPSIDAQSDLGQIVARLHSEPVSRVYVPELGPGFVLTFAGIPTTYAGQMLSLDSMLPVDRLDPTYCNIFNVGYVITRSFGPRPGSLTPLLETSKYVLYRTDAEGYAQFGALRWGNIDAADLSKAQDQLYAGNFEWLRDGEAAQGKFIRWNFPARTEPTGEAGPGGPGSCTIAAEKFSSQRVEVTVDCREDATLIIKQTFHPNWHVVIDNVERPDFMVSPSYLGVVVPAGHHEVRAEYRSSALKKVLLVVGALALIAILLLRRRLDAIDTLIG